MAEFTILAALVKVLVDRVKGAFALSGDLITIAAAGVGVVLAFLLDVNVAAELVGASLDNAFGVVVSGIGIGLGAGFLHDALSAVGGRT